MPDSVAGCVDRFWGNNNNNKMLQGLTDIAQMDNICQQSLWVAKKWDISRKNAIFEEIEKLREVTIRHNSRLRFSLTIMLTFTYFPSNFRFLVKGQCFFLAVGHLFD